MTRLQIALVLIALALIAAMFLWHTPDSWLVYGGPFLPRHQLLILSEP